MIAPGLMVTDTDRAVTITQSHKVTDPDRVVTNTGRLVKTQTLGDRPRPGGDRHRPVSDSRTGRLVTDGLEGGSGRGCCHRSVICDALGGAAVIVETIIGGGVGGSEPQPDYILIVMEAGAAHLNSWAIVMTEGAGRRRRHSSRLRGLWYIICIYETTVGGIEPWLRGRDGRPSPVSLVAGV